jgi:hypothetical protein
LSTKKAKSYREPEFINSRDARPLRILAEYLAPKSRFDFHGVADTIVFFGSARLKPATPWYEAARNLAFRLTRWSRELDSEKQRFVVCSGAGPGIMEAANRGAAEAGGLNIGLAVSLPHEGQPNVHVSRELLFRFHYFFMRKFWFAYLAKAMIIFPGGYGTLDELFEILTLVQTRKMNKPMPIVLFGTSYWKEVINFDALVRHGTISPEDVNLVFRTDSVDEAYDWVVQQLTARSLDKPGATL